MIYYDDLPLSKDILAALNELKIDYSHYHYKGNPSPARCSLPAISKHNRTQQNQACEKKEM